VFEFEVSGSNGDFSGAAKTYVAIGGLAEAAEILEGFPKNTSDVRELQFGASGREFAGGSAHLRFFCKNSAGHAVELRIESEDERNTGSNWNLPEQTVFFFGEIEASAVDSFVGGLRQLEEAKGGVASLRFADSPPG
jgi:hypothetical protein